MSKTRTVAFSLSSFLIIFIVGLDLWFLAGLLLSAQAQTVTFDTTPPTISNVRAENIIGPGAQIKWTSDEPSDSKVVYGTTSGSYPFVSESRCDGGGNVTTHCVNLVGLAASTVYYYKVSSRDAAGTKSDSGEFQFTSAAGETVPAVPSGLTASLAVSGVDVNLSWTDNSTNESEFKIYRRVSGGAWSFLVSVSSNVTTHTDTGLASGTYEYHVNSCNAQGCSADSNVVSVTISGGTTGGAPAGGTLGGSVDTTPPAISNIRVENFFGYSAEIKWTTDENSDSKVKYGTKLGEYPLVSESRCDAGGSVLEHCVNLAGLSPATTYYYRVVSKDAAGNEATSAEHSFASASQMQLYVSAWGLFVDASGTSTVGIAFSVEVDQTGFSDATVFIHKASDPPDPAYRLPLTFQKESYHVMLRTALAAGTEYKSVVKSSVRSSSGQTLTADYTCRFTALASGYYTSCPTGPATPPAPPPAPAPVIFDATVEGTVVDSQDIPVAQVGVHIYSKDFSKNFGTVTDVNGEFRISLPAGEYFVEVFLPPERTDLIKPVPIVFSVSSGGTKVLKLRLETAIRANKVITGTVLFSNGAPVTDARVGAYSELSRQWTSTVTDAGGKYTLRVGPGRWIVGTMPVDPSIARWHWTGAFQEVEFKDDPSEELRTINFTIPLADAKIIVQIVDEVAKPIANAGVVLDTISAVTHPIEPYPPPQFRKSDAAGLATFLVTPRTYYLRAFLPPERGLFNPDEQQVTVSAGQELQVRLVFRVRAIGVSATVSGTAKLEDGRAVDAFVWGWSEKGGFAKTEADIKGTFSLLVALGDRWHIGAGKDIGGFPYKSAEVIVDVESTSTAIELILVKISLEPLPPPVVKSEVATRPIIAQTQDGAQVVIPAGAALPSGTVKVEMVPTVEAPSQAASRVVGTVYDVDIKDEAGKKIIELKQEIEITLPYTEEDLSKQGVSEDTLTPSFFDEATGTWVKVENYTIDKEKNVVIVRVKHLTRFALVAPADITPPQPPTNLRARPSGRQEVTLAWVNPPADFHHVKVYRSETSGVPGALLDDLVTTATYKDMTVSIGKTYHYLLKAVDAAGNDSTPSQALAVRVTGEIVPPALTFARTLRLGMRGADVRALQELLVKEGVYPEGRITGFFGSLTRQAVIRFQEKYADEILRPVGLTRGTGVVGPATRKKLNEFSAK